MLLVSPHPTFEMVLKCPCMPSLTVRSVSRTRGTSGQDPRGYRDDPCWEETVLKVWQAVTPALELVFCMGDECELRPSMLSLSRLDKSLCVRNQRQAHSQGSSHENFCRFA